jgi:hypothetical protein
MPQRYVSARSRSTEKRVPAVSASNQASYLYLGSWRLGAALTHDHHRQSRVLDDTRGNAAQRSAGDA